MNGIPEQWRALEERVARACGVVGRDPASVRVLAAVKTQDPERIAEVLACGARLLGHNRAQEMADVVPRVRALWPGDFENHFIGALQTNKVNQVMRYVTCVQSVDRLDLAGKLSRAAAGEGRVLDVFVEVNSSGEETKAGVTPDGAVALCGAVAALEGLRLRGLMTVGANSPDLDLVRESHELLARLSADVTSSGLPGTSGAGELSMGMSRDLEVAIAAGATMVRVGTALFGARRPAV